MRQIGLVPKRRTSGDVLDQTNRRRLVPRLSKGGTRQSRMAVVLWRVGTVATLLSVLLACFLTHEANGVISGPKFPRNNGVIEPQVMEIKPEDGTWLPSRVRGRGTNAAEYADFKESLGRSVGGRGWGRIVHSL